MEILPGAFAALPVEIIETILKKIPAADLIPLGRVSKQFIPIVQRVIENCLHTLSKTDFLELKKKVSKLDYKQLDIALSSQRNQTLFQLIILVQLSASAFIWKCRVEKHRPQKQLIKFEAYLEAKKRFEDNFAAFSLKHQHLENELSNAHHFIKEKLNAKTKAWLDAMQIKAKPTDFDGVPNFSETYLADSGSLFYRGLRCLKNEASRERGVQLVRLAAHLKFAPAMTKLAGMYLHGEHVIKNVPLALEYYYNAVDLEDIIAKVNLGYILIFGNHVTQDVAMGFYLLKKAAEAGLAEAQYTLGFCYWHGICAKQNRRMALNYFTKAAKNGDLFAKVDLALIYNDSSSGYYNLSKGFKWSLRAAQKGFEPLQIYVGYCYVAGIVVDEDHERAFYWTQKSTTIPNDIAYNNLACLYELGIGTEINFSEALRLYQKAAEMGSQLAKKNLENLAARLTQSS